MRSPSEKTDNKQSKDAHVTVHPEASSSTLKTPSSAPVYQYAKQQRYATLTALLAVVYGVVAFRIQTGGNDQTDIPTAVSGDSHNISTEDFQDKQVSGGCSIFMAPSSLMGSSGFGMYTTRPLKQGESFLNGPDGPNIPVIDCNNSPSGQDHLAKERMAWINLFDAYWMGRGLADQTAYESGFVMDFQIMFNSLPNHHCVLSTIDHLYWQPPYDDTMVNRSKDPGAGAFSYHTGRNYVATRDVDAGEELFMNYGHCKNPEEEEEEDEDDEEERELPAWAVDIPKTKDFVTASKITVDIWKQLKSQPTTAQDATLDSETTFNVASALSIKKARRKATKAVLNLVPGSEEELHEIMLRRKGDTLEDVARSLAMQNLNRRTPEWITQNGMCIEQLVPGRSRIKQAGQGGFSQWFLKKGEIIVPAPLLQILDRDVLKIFNDDSEEVGTQLLLNYCFGHRSSSMLLCPDTNAILVNHCSSRQNECGPKGPNAEIRWASGWERNNDKWLGMSIDEISRQPGRGLAMEIVATRDIEEGEEVFIDYGKGWDDAWDNHVHEWKERLSKDTDIDTDFLSIKELNDDTGPIPSIFVSGDLRENRVHSSVFTGCAYWSTEEDDAEEYEEEYDDWRNMPDEEILITYSNYGDRFIANYTTHMETTYWPCSVMIQEDDAGTTYTVQIHQTPLLPMHMPWYENDLPRILTNYPRTSIHFFRKSFTSDQYMRGAFRHYIEIPDAMLPDKWRNRDSVG